MIKFITCVDTRERAEKKSSQHDIYIQYLMLSKREAEKKTNIELNIHTHNFMNTAAEKCCMRKIGKNK